MYLQELTSLTSIFVIDVLDIKCNTEYLLQLALKTTLVLRVATDIKNIILNAVLEVKNSTSVV